MGNIPWHFKGIVVIKVKGPSPFIEMFSNAIKIIVWNNRQISKYID